MQLKGRDYLNVQNRLLWFIRDQRAFISGGLARVPYVIQTELVEMDREVGIRALQDLCARRARQRVHDVRLRVSEGFR